MTDDARPPGLTFGEMAEEYDRVRLRCPEALIDDVLAYSGLPDGEAGRALEVGAGTGKATLDFAARGVPIVAVEPDPAMAAVLARHAAGLPRVRIVRSAFEEYRPEERFRLLLSADAWHWTRPADRWRLAAEALAPGGALALCWHNDRIDDPGLRQSMMDMLAAYAPTITVSDEPTGPDRLFAVWPGDELADRPEFEDLAGRTYPWHLTVPGADYLTRMATRSQLRMMTEPVRARLLAALAEVFTGPVPVTVTTVLYLARRAR